MVYLRNMFKILESCLICYYNTIFRKSAYIMVESDKDMLQIYVERHFKYIFLVFLLAVRLTTVAPYIVFACARFTNSSFLLQFELKFRKNRKFIDNTKRVDLMYWVIGLYRSSPQEVFLRKVVLKICRKFTGEQPCRSVIMYYIQQLFWNLSFLCILYLGGNIKSVAASEQRHSRKCLK